MDRNIAAIEIPDPKNARKVRYILINTETGEVIDDAQGYGFKTPQKAYAAYTHKKN